VIEEVTDDKVHASYAHLVSFLVTTEEIAKTLLALVTKLRLVPHAYHAHSHINTQFQIKLDALNQIALLSHQIQSIITAMEHAKTVQQVKSF
jgi:hypothetical protein